MVLGSDAVLQVPIRMSCSVLVRSFFTFKTEPLTHLGLLSGVCCIGNSATPKLLPMDLTSCVR